jgi:hypothetical protein
MLTDSGIRAAKPKTGRTVKFSDSDGRQLWVQPSGSKFWNLAYRFAGKQRKLAIGAHPCRWKNMSTPSPLRASSQPLLAQEASAGVHGSLKRPTAAAA